MFPPPTTPRSEQSTLWQNWLRGSIGAPQLTGCEGCVTWNARSTRFLSTPTPPGPSSTVGWGATIVLLDGNKYKFAIVELNVHFELDHICWGCHEIPPHRAMAVQPLSDVDDSGVSIDSSSRESERPIRSHRSDMPLRISSRDRRSHSFTACSRLGIRPSSAARASPRQTSMSRRKLTIFLR